MKFKILMPILIAVTNLCSCGGNSSTYNEKTIYLYYGDNVVRTETVKIGDSYTAPQDIVSPAYNFLGWYLNPACTSFMKASFPMKIEDDVYLYADYQIKMFTIVYDLVDPDASAETIETVVTYGQRIAYIDPSYVGPTGKVFAGWYENKDYTSKWNFSTLIYENTRIYAKWNAE